MPLISCPACEKQVSPNAAACPNCGEPLKNEPEKTVNSIDLKDPVHIVGLIIAAFLAVYVFYLFVEALT